MLKCAMILLALGATPALADLTVTFTEGAPKDRITISNTGGCAIGDLTLTIDLGTAPAGLIFDVTGSGAGVAVFQPFEVTEGAAFLRDMPQVLDGDSAVSVTLRSFGPSARFSFTIDIDDSGTGRQTIVSGTEIAGATFAADFGGMLQSVVFDESGTARLPQPACLS